MLSTPPIGIVLDQRVIENNQNASDGVNKKVTSIEQSLFAFTCSVDDSALKIIPLDITVKLDSISAIPQRNSCNLTNFVLNFPNQELSSTNVADRFLVKKRRIHAGDSVDNRSIIVDVMNEVNRFAYILCDTIESELDSEDVKKM
jgi:hypothetical protein